MTMMTWLSISMMMMMMMGAAARNHAENDNGLCACDFPHDNCRMCDEKGKKEMAGKKYDLVRVVLTGATRGM